MAQQYLYFSLLPEALIFSMLPPQQFGKYLAIGDKKQSHSPAVFFDVDPALEVEGLAIGKARQRCVEHEDGSPRRSAYVAIHNVIDRLPVSALGDLHLATRDGLVLSLQRGGHADAPGQRAFLYQEICPVTPRVVSTLPPQEFCRYVTHRDNPLFLPRMIFADMRLDGLATDPDHAEGKNLPYANLSHLRSCITSLGDGDGKKTKIVQRDLRPDDFFYVIENGFYLGDGEDFAHYPMPPEDALLGEHNRWWNSANKVERY